LPEFGLHLVITRIGDTLGRIAVAQQQEAPAAQDELTGTILALLDDRRHVPGEDRGQRIEHCDAVVRQAELACEIGAACLDRVEVAHSPLMPAWQEGCTASMVLSTRGFLAGGGPCPLRCRQLLNAALASSKSRMFFSTL